MSRNYLSRHDELRTGDYLLSNNREWKAILQDDGNFVIYRQGPVWASDTVGSGAFRLCMQDDCNLVMYTKDKKPVWSSGPYFPGYDGMCRLQLTNDGRLVVSKEAEEIWSSANSKGKKL